MRQNVLGVPLDDFSLSDIADKIVRGHKVFQVFVNVHKVNLFHANPQLRDLVSDEHCVFSADGIWVLWSARRKRFFPKQRFGGLDAIEKLFSLAQERSYTIYLLGARKDVLDKAVQSLQARFPKACIVGTRDGFFLSEEEIMRDVQGKKPNILFIALPSPRKELFGYKLFKHVDSLNYVAGVGGAFDVLAGQSRRAPEWIQKIGLEWLHRCCSEPHRLFKQYFLDGLGLLRIIKEKGI